MHCALLRSSVLGGSALLAGQLYILSLAVGPVLAQCWASVGEPVAGDVAPVICKANVGKGHNDQAYAWEDRVEGKPTGATTAGGVAYWATLYRAGTQSLPRQKKM